MDGSAAPFVELIERAGVRDQDARPPRDPPAKAGSHRQRGGLDLDDAGRGVLHRLSDRVRLPCDRTPGKVRRIRERRLRRRQSRRRGPSASSTKSTVCGVRASRAAPRSTTPSPSTARGWSTAAVCASTTSSCATRFSTASATCTLPARRSLPTWSPCGSGHAANHELLRAMFDDRDSWTWWEIPRAPEAGGVAEPAPGSRLKHTSRRAPGPPEPGRLPRENALDCAPVARSAHVRERVRDRRCFMYRIA